MAGSGVLRAAAFRILSCDHGGVHIILLDANGDQIATASTSAAVARSAAEQLNESADRAQEIEVRDRYAARRH